MDLGRLRIELQGGLELAGGVGLVVLLQEEQPGLVMRRPTGRIELQGVGIQLVDEEVELVGEAAPPRILGGGQTDPAERFGLLHVVIVVEIDQPMIAALGLLQAALGAIQLGPDPAGQQLLVVQCKRRPHAGRRLLQVAAIEGQTGQLRLKLRAFFRQGLQRPDGLLRFAVGLQRAGQPQRGRRVLGGQRLVDLSRLGVFAFPQQLAGLLQRQLGRGGDGRQQEASSGEEEGAFQGKGFRD